MRVRLWLVAALCVAACGGSTERPWTVVAKGQPAALLSLWGASPTDVWVVGGHPADGTGPIVEHYDGTAWTKLDTGLTSVDLWWVKGFAGGPVFMSGEGGTILRYQNGAFDKLTTPGTGIVFGLWGAAPDDLWAVGGNRGGGGGGFVWRFDGTTWTPSTEVPSDITSQGTCWKVNGVSADNVWISCTNGTTLHWDGTSLTRVDIAAAQQDQASLFSVAGTAQRFVTVGGAFDGVLYENTGSGWKSAVPPGGPVLTGVAVSDTDAYAVGQAGVILRRTDHGWVTDGAPVTQQNLHATWIDPMGGAWAVGGQFDDVQTSDGVLLYKGDTPPKSLP